MSQNNFEMEYTGNNFFWELTFLLILSCWGWIRLLAMCFHMVLLVVFCLFSAFTDGNRYSKKLTRNDEELMQIARNLVSPFFLLRWLFFLSLSQAAIRYGADPRVFSIMSKVCVPVLCNISLDLVMSLTFIPPSLTRNILSFHKLLHFSFVFRNSWETKKVMLKV